MFWHKLGYILTKNNNFKKIIHTLFETHEAHAHNHFLDYFYVDENGLFKQITITDHEPTPEKERINLYLEYVGNEASVKLTDAIAFYSEVKNRMHTSPYRQIGCFDSMWMLHVAINLYNENGLFADTFPLIDTMSK
jgi:alpha-D-ribose 1-methylphosphonate 5-triphosphate diphosphatase PhnM